MKRKKIRNISITKRIKEDKDASNMEEDIEHIREMLRCIGAYERSCREIKKKEEEI